MCPLKKICKDNFTCKPLTEKEKLALAIALGATTVAVGAIAIFQNANKIKDCMEGLKCKMAHMKNEILCGLKKDADQEEEMDTITIELNCETGEIIHQAEILIAELRKRMENGKSNA